MHYLNEDFFKCKESRYKYALPSLKFSNGVFVLLGFMAHSGGEVGCISSFHSVLCRCH